MSVEIEENANACTRMYRLFSLHILSLFLIICFVLYVPSLVVCLE